MPYERYATVEDVLPQFRDSPESDWGTCLVCKNVVTVAEILDGKIIIKRNRQKRHESCGGPPGDDRPVRHYAGDARSENRGGQAGSQGNEQGRVIRKGSTLS